MTEVPIIKKPVKLLFSMKLQYMSKSGVIQVMHRNNFHQMFPFENMNPLKQRKSKKEFSLCKTFLEKFKNFNRRDSLCFSVCKSASFIFLFLGLSLLKWVLPIIRIAFDGKYIEMDFSENLEMKPKFEVEDANFSIFPTSYLLCTVQ